MIVTLTLPIFTPAAPPRFVLKTHTQMQSTPTAPSLEKTVGVLAQVHPQPRSHLWGDNRGLKAGASLFIVSDIALVTEGDTNVV